MKVLVAEDEPVTRAMLVGSLRRLGHEVCETANGREAWERLHEERIRLVISDWLMPEMDGLELCHRIRALAGEPYTYVILVTAMNGKGRYLEGMEAGADDFLTKPYDRDELQASLRVAERVLGLEQEILRLRGVAAVCPYCRQIEDEGRWVSLEEYVGNHAGQHFAPEPCPGCASGTGRA